MGQMTGTADYTNTASNRQQHAQRMINVDVRGSSRIFNYWAGARVGDNLYLKSVKVDMRKIPEQGYNTTQNVQFANKEYHEKKQKHMEHNSCVQILPYLLSRSDDSMTHTQELKA